MKTILTFTKSGFFKIVFSLLFLCSCRAKELARPDESVKDLTGSWKIVKAVQNGKDITGRFNFASFRINFLDNKKYEIQNQLPFIVKKNGAFDLDDPQYPFSIKFNEEGSSTAVSSNFNYPITNGARLLNLSFSPGCVGNSYIYTLQKVHP